MASPNIVNLTKDNFTAEVLKASGPVLVDSGGMVRPVQDDRPILDELAEEYSGRVKIGKVNIDQDQELAAQYSIRSIPTLLLFIKARSPTRWWPAQQEGPQGQLVARDGLSRR